MNYRHAYHAGNFADVLKHAVLIGLIEALQAKPKPLCYIDTHAGSGLYDLGGEAARKTGESAAGIERMRQQRGGPALLQRYVELVDAEGGNAYPGSPRIVQQLLRDDDEAQLCELQPDEASSLRALFGDDHRIHVHQRDGYAALKALLPPTQKRGLVLIDPPFEAQAEEFRIIESSLKTALTRWPNGVYAVWYPIKLGRQVQPFRRWLGRCGAKTVLDAELLLAPDDSPLRLNGAGMAILNPPWQFDKVLSSLLPALAARLGRNDMPARYRLNWLKREEAST